MQQSVTQRMIKHPCYFNNPKSLNVWLRFFLHAGGDGKVDVAVGVAPAAANADCRRPRLAALFANACARRAQKPKALDPPTLLHQTLNHNHCTLTRQTQKP